MLACNLFCTQPGTTVMESKMDTTHKQVIKNMNNKIQNSDQPVLQSIFSVKAVKGIIL